MVVEAKTRPVSTKLEAANPPVNLIPPPRVVVPEFRKGERQGKEKSPETASVPPTERLPAKIEVAGEEVALKEVMVKGLVVVAER